MNNLPAEVLAAVEQAIGSCRCAGAVGGGCIHPAVRLETADGPVFLKYGRDTAPLFFATEAEGLRQLRSATTRLQVPAVLAHADVDDGRQFGWLLLEWVEAARRSADFSARLAEGLTELHAPVAGGRGWGWGRDGFIGSLPQHNRPAGDWAGFWRQRRLEPQLHRARSQGRLPASEKEWARLIDHLPELLSAADDDGPSLLHGDLWGGNILATSSGRPAIVDPAAYRGHREVDLAMSELFGGLDASFYEAYAALRPLRAGYREWRRGTYQLYYLLVHVNLFGDGYVARTAATLRSVLASL